MTSPVPTSVSNLRDYIFELFVAANRPTLRSIAQRTALSHTTVADVIHSRRRATWATVSALVEYFGGDMERARQLWDDQYTNVPELDSLVVAGRSSVLATLKEIRNLLRDIRDRLPEPPTARSDERDPAEHAADPSPAPTGAAGGGEPTDAHATT